MPENFFYPQNCRTKFLIWLKHLIFDIDFRCYGKRLIIVRSWRGFHVRYPWAGCPKWKKGLIVRNQTNTLLHQIQTETSPDRYRLVLFIITPEPDQYQKCLLGTRTEPDQNWCTSFIAQHRDKREPESELLHRQFQKSLIRNLNLNVWILFSFK